MPRFFFDHGDIGDWREDDGVELADIAAVEREVSRVLPQIASEAIRNARSCHKHFAIIVRDEQGLPVYVAEMSFAGMRLQV